LKHSSDNLKRKLNNVNIAFHEIDEAQMHIVLKFMREDGGPLISVHSLPPSYMVLGDAQHTSHGPQ
jgi:hypothetical protein